MNKVFIATSIDGYIATVDNQLDWLNMISNPNHDDMGYLDMMSSIDAIVMGRKTYETVASFEGPWPYKKRVFVLSNTLSNISTELCDKVEIITGSLEEIIRNLNEKGFNNLYIDGGKTISSFLEADLIDDLILTTIPIILGKGIPLFNPIDKVLKFSLIKSTLYLDQLVQRHYKRLR